MGGGSGDRLTIGSSFRPAPSTPALPPMWAPQTLNTKIPQEAVLGVVCAEHPSPGQCGDQPISAGLTGGVLPKTPGLSPLISPQEGWKRGTPPKEIRCPHLCKHNPEGTLTPPAPRPPCPHFQGPKHPGSGTGRWWGAGLSHCQAPLLGARQQSNVFF